MIDQQQLTTARVRVPGSTSNLGAGFDCVGLALDRYLTADFRPGTEPLRLERYGTLAPLTHTTDDDLLVRVFRARLAELGAPAPTGVLRAASEIPVGRGLGSSAAAVVAALLLAEAAAGVTHPGRDADALLRRAVRWEGHPDNVAPSICGGLVAVAPGRDGEPHVLPLALSADVGFAYAAPSQPVSTAEARAALPDVVAHARAAHALGRVAALLQGLASGDPELLRIGFQDELHVPYRLPLIPHAAAAQAATLHAGAWAVTVSGSGSGLIAVCPRGLEQAVADAMAREFGGGAAAEAVAFAVAPDRAGARYAGAGPCR